MSHAAASIMELQRSRTSTIAFAMFAIALAVVGHASDDIGPATPCSSEDNTCGGRNSATGSVLLQRSWITRATVRKSDDDAEEPMTQVSVADAPAASASRSSSGFARVSKLWLTKDDFCSRFGASSSFCKSSFDFTLLVMAVEGLVLVSLFAGARALAKKAESWKAKPKSIERVHRKSFERRSKKGITREAQGPDDALSEDSSSDFDMAFGKNRIEEHDEPDSEHEPDCEPVSGDFLRQKILPNSAARELTRPAENEPDTEEPSEETAGNVQLYPASQQYLATAADAASLVTTETESSAEESV